MPPQLQLRPIKSSDRPFLFEVFASTRPEIQTATHLPEEQRKALMLQQFRDQDLRFNSNFPHADYGIIEYGNTEIGRLYINRTKDDVHIIDISILPDYRGQGLGTKLIRAIIEEARLTKRQVHLQVEKSSSALPLYRRLGFAVIAEKPKYLEMTWTISDQSKIVVDGAD